MVKFVDTSWLQQHLNDPRVSTIDPRPFVKYTEGHIPKAVNLPLAKLLDSKTLSLNPVNQLATLFGQTGIDANNTVVLYDSYDGQSAAMLAWTLEYLGHPNVNVLSSRLDGWIDQGGEILYKPVDPQPATFEARPNNVVRATSTHVLQKEYDKILDLRSRDEFSGKVATEVRTGRIPGSTNLPWTELIDSGPEFLRTRPDLEGTMERIGLTPGNRIVTYCSYGPRAAIGYLALQHLGYNVRMYDGSFHEWAQHPEFPVEGEGLQIQF